MLELVSSSARVVVDPNAGGRIVSLTIDGLDIVVGGPSSDPLVWGSYPMVPFAGRIREGRFEFDGTEHEVPVDLGAHAIHGYGYTSCWDVVDDRTIALDLAPPWPYAGRVTQTFYLSDDRLLLHMQLLAVDAQPAMLGWHPWFRRDIGVGADVELSFGPAKMYELDDAAIPTGVLVDPPQGPWDNCFTDLAAEPVLRWGDRLQLTLSSSADHWVVYDQPDHAICVEPQTDAPDAVNRGRGRVEAGETIEISFTLAWR